MNCKAQLKYCLIVHFQRKQLPKQTNKGLREIHPVKRARLWGLCVGTNPERSQERAQPCAVAQAAKRPALGSSEQGTEGPTQERTVVWGETREATHNDNSEADDLCTGALECGVYV